MADLRALMKAQKSQQRIQHPYAKYTNSGQLSCSLCILTLKSDVLWPSHLTSKTHRNNLKRVKEEELEKERASLKRPVEHDQADEEETMEDTGKRRRLDGQEDAAEASTSFLPEGFFSNPSNAPATTDNGTEAQDDAPAAEDMDEEWAAFEATLNAPEEDTEQPVASTSTGYTTAATITAQPQLFEDDDTGGEYGLNGTNGQNGILEEGDAGEDEEDDAPKETEEERREREEREELMERIEIEEREQQEADERVDALKKRLLAVRAAKKAPSTDASNRQTNGAGSLASNTAGNGDGPGVGKAGRKARRNRW